MGFPERIRLTDVLALLKAHEVRTDAPAATELTRTGNALIDLCLDEEISVGNAVLID